MQIGQCFTAKGFKTKNCLIFRGGHIAMPDLNETSNRSKTDKNTQNGFSSQWRILLLCAVVLCLSALWINCHQPRITYAIAPIPSEQSPIADGPQPQANETKTKNMDKLATMPSLWPVNGAVTSGFGGRNSPFGDGNELHSGIDIAADMGALIVATADGKIVQSGPFGGYGNMVQIDHGNGISTIYGHNSQLTVNVGQFVKKGQVISSAGSTGKSTGPHVHYEVRENDIAVNPWKYLVSNKRIQKL